MDGPKTFPSLLFRRKGTRGKLLAHPNIFLGQQRKNFRRLAKNNIVEKDKKLQFGYTMQTQFWRKSAEVPIFTKYILTHCGINVNRIFRIFDIFILFFRHAEKASRITPRDGFLSPTKCAGKPTNCSFTAKPGRKRNGGILWFRVHAIKKIESYVLYETAYKFGHFAVPHPSSKPPYRRF